MKPDASRRAAVTVELTPPSPGDYMVKVGWRAAPAARVQVKVGRTTFPRVNSASGCASAPLGIIRLAGTVRVELTANGPSPILDYIELEGVDSKRR